MQIIIIGKPIQHKGFHILVQNIGNIFQAIIHKDGLFYQHYIEVKYSEGRKRFTTKEMTNAYKLVLDQAIATCELILDPKGEKLKKSALKGKTKKERDIIEGISEHKGGKKKLPN